MSETTVKVIAVAAREPGRWHFATRSVLKPGLSLSIRTWRTKRAALLAGLREHGQAPAENG